MKKMMTFATSLLVWSSCTHYYYVPTVQNVPLLNEKKETKAAVHHGFSDETNSLDIQVAHAFTDKFAIMTNYLYAKGSDNTPNDWGKGNYMDAALGYYKPFENKLIYEMYGGVGACNQSHRYLNGKANLSFVSLFFQPSIGYKHNHFEFALSTKMSELSFKKIESFLDSSDIDAFALNQVNINKTSKLLEPALTIRGGGKYTKLQMQFVLSQNRTHPHLNFERHKLSFGLTYSFAQQFSAKTQKQRSRKQEAIQALAVN